ncbi:MAG: hypothetical protein QOF83_2617, partial [Solirubrobacteraceae bacterium]|nr:hypothetical protein [Solirubrobacteraceae bacterium]
MVANQGRLAEPACEAEDVADVAPDRQRKRSFLVRTALALVSTSFLTSALGFIFWAVSARFFSPSNIGEAATAIAAMNLIAPITTLGFGTLLLAELPTMSARRAELVSTAAVFSGIFGGAAALICAMVLPHQFLGLPGVGRDGSATLLFAAGVAAQGVAMMLDTALLSVAGGGPQLWRNATLAVGKLVLLVAFALTLSQHGSLSIYASWFLANVISIVTMTIWLARKRQVALRRMWPTRSALRGMRYVAAQHHALNLALGVPYFSMPIVANVTLGSERAGYLYATWSVAGFVFLLPIALTTALFASGARDGSTFLMELRVTLRYSLAACAAANLVLLPLGGVVLHVFGSAYANNGHTLLLLVCLAGFGMIVKDHHATIARVTGSVGREAMWVWGLTACELVAAWVGASLNGLTGLAEGWLLAVALEIVVFGPLVLRAYRGRIELPVRRFMPMQLRGSLIRKGSGNGEVGTAFRSRSPIRVRRQACRPGGLTIVLLGYRLRSFLRSRARGRPGGSAADIEVTGVHRVLVIGAGTRLLSAMSYYTLHLTNAFAQRFAVAIIPMRQLIPTFLYPGRSRVGSASTRLELDRNVAVMGEIDWFWGFSLARAMWRLRAWRPDAVVFQWWTGSVLHTYLALALFARLQGTRVVVEFHEVLDTAEQRIPLARAWVRLLGRPFFGLADAFVIHSEADREPIGERYSIGNRPCVAIPHGPINHFASDDHSPSLPLRDPPPGIINLLFFGIIRPYKGLEDLVEAFDLLDDDEVMHYWLTVVGETWEGWDLPIRLIESSRHRSRITLVNRFVEDGEVTAYFAGADAAVLPYHRSSASSPASVAMANGLPLVLTAVGGLPEAVADYEGAILVPPR